MRLILFLFLAALLPPSVMAYAQPTPAALTGTVGGGSTVDPASATRAWLETVPAEKRARSDAYFEGGYWLMLWNFLLGVAIALFLLASGISARLRDFAERLTRSRLLQPAIYAVPYVLIVFALSFPLELYAGFVREHAYGLATQTFGSWLRDQFVGLTTVMIASAIVFAVLYLVFRHAPRSWWLWGGALGFLFVTVATMITPVFVAPLFNTYTPLVDPKISRPILAMARANQIPVREVFQVDESRQSNRISAHVSGMFGTTRIALNDNLLKQCTLPEIRAVMAHEMGHYVLNHAMKLTLYFTIFIAGAFVFARVVFDGIIRRWGTRWRVQGISDPAGFPLLALLFSTYFFLITPFSNTAVRVTEREADAFGLNAAREADGFAKVALKLGSYRKLDPGAVEEIIFFDHPGGRARIRMAMDWKAANLPAGDAEGALGPNR